MPPRLFLEGRFSPLTPLGLKQQLAEMTGGKIDLTIKAITDNKSARDAVYSDSGVSERCLKGDVAIIKEMLEDNRVQEIRWVGGKHMLADVLTKQTAPKLPLLKVLQEGKIEQEDLDLIN